MVVPSLDTIYSVGEGRTVVVAVDGCSGCLSAFEEFLQEKQEPEDRVVAVVKGGTSKGPEGIFSDPLLLGARVITKVAQAVQRPRTPCEDSQELPSFRNDSKLPNRVVVPGKPLTDFADWDKGARLTLGRLAARAERRSVRFEAIRVPACRRPQHFAEAVMALCAELDANLLVIASHKQPGGTSTRSLSAVFSVNTSCPVLVLGKKNACEDDPPDESDGEESQKLVHGDAFPFRRVIMRSASFSIGRSLSQPRTRDRSKDDSDESLSNSRETQALPHSESVKKRRSKSMSDDVELTSSSESHRKNEEFGPVPGPLEKQALEGHEDQSLENAGAAVGMKISGEDPGGAAEHEQASHSPAPPPLRGSASGKSTPDRKLKSAGKASTRGPRVERRPHEAKHLSLGDKWKAVCKKAVDVQKEAVANYFSP